MKNVSQLRFGYNQIHWALTTNDGDFCGYVHLTGALARISLMPVDNEAVIFI